MINSIGNVPLPEKQASSIKADREAASDKNGLNKGWDTVSIRGEYSASVTYTGTSTDVTGTQSLNASLRDYVVSLLEQQGLSTKIATGDDSVSDLRTMTPAEAQKLIFGDGYWGVEKTSDRIVEFATSAAGNDPARLDQIKQAVITGFKQAEEIFGGALPDISQKTLDKTMEKLDKWAENFSATAAAQEKA